MNLNAYCKTMQYRLCMPKVLQNPHLRKTLMVMKLTTLLILSACLHVHARGFSQRVTLMEKNVAITKVFAEIEKQTGYTFFYRTELLSKSDKITIYLKNGTLQQALEKCLNNARLSYSIMDKLIIITAAEEQEYLFKVEATPPKQVKGKVTSADGTALEGVNLIIKNSKRGTNTNGKGEFFIDANTNDILVVSYVGFETKEITVADRDNLVVMLAESKSQLAEVAVVGYGKQSRKVLSSSVSTVKADDLNKGAITDVGQLLQGKVPGLNITASGDPNKPAAVILRGVSTINSSQGPFYVIDGIPGADISMVAPDDIAAIDVLKDAAATAIYGNRGANGVIMITTKKGKSGAMAVSYNGYVGLEKVSNKLKMMDANQLRAFLARNGQAIAPSDDLGANTDWQSSVQRNSAISHNHNISFSGGTPHSNYNASINYVRKEGILLNSDLERLIARLSVEQNAFNDNVKFGLNVSNSISNANDIPYRNSVLLESTYFLPVSPIRRDDGTYFENFTHQNYYNPVAMMNHSTMNTKYNNLIGNFTTHVKLPLGLTYDLNLSYLNYNTQHAEFYDTYYTRNYNNMYNTPDPGLGYHTPQSFGSNGQATRSSYANTSKILETFFTWNKRFGFHSFNAVAGYSWQDNKIGNGFQVTTSNFPSDNLSYNNLALSSPYSLSGYQISLGPDGVYQENRLISDFARLNYNYKDKYLLQGSIRRDGSSVFGANNQWGYFPSIGVAWRTTQEAFMQNQNIFSDLKVRASYGVTGNATGFNAFTAQIISGSLGTYYNAGGYIGAYGPTQTSNPDLKWEKTSTANLGVDFGFLKGRLSGSIDLYNKKTTGMIYSYSIDPLLVPSGTITSNGGSMSNKGIELSLNATLAKTANFSWNSTLNLAHNKNVITSLTNPLFSGGDSILLANPEGLGQSSHSLQILKEGKPLGQFFSPIYAGKNANGISQFVARDGKLTTTPQIGTDYFYIGDAQPKLMLGWSNSFKYKRFDLNIFLRGVFGNKIFNATRADLFRPNTAQYTNILVDASNESTADYNAFLYSSRYVESGSYLRFDNATFAYNFKIHADFIKSIKLYTTVNNLFVITKFSGIDPEVNQGGIAPGVDYNNFYPRTRSFLVGVNVSF